MKFLEILEKRNFNQRADLVISSYSTHLLFLEGLANLHAEIQFRSFDLRIDYQRQFNNVIDSTPCDEMRSNYYQSIFAKCIKFQSTDLNNYLLFMLTQPEGLKKEVEWLETLGRTSYEECQKRSKGLFMSSAPVEVSGLNVNFSEISMEYLTALMTCKMMHEYLIETGNAYTIGEVNKKPNSSKVQHFSNDREESKELINEDIDELVKDLEDKGIHPSFEEVQRLKDYTQGLFLDDRLPDEVVPFKWHITRKKKELQDLICQTYNEINKVVYKKKARNPNLETFIKVVFSVFSNVSEGTIYKKMPG